MEECGTFLITSVQTPIVTLWDCVTGKNGHAQKGIQEKNIVSFATQESINSDM